MRFAKNLSGVQKKSWKYRIRVLERIVVVTDKDLGAISKQMCLWLRLHQEGTFRTREREELGKKRYREDALKW